MKAPPALHPVTYRHRLLATFFAILVLGSNARSQGFHFFTFDLEQGLPSSFVESLAQSHRGAIWASTRNGVARNDGVSFALIPGTENHRLGRLVASPRSGVWALGMKPSLPGLRLTRHHTSVVPPLPIPATFFLACVALEHEGGEELWVATEMGGIHRFDGTSWSPHPAFGPDRVGTVYALERSGETILLASSTGAFAIDRDFGLTRLPFPETVNDPPRAIAVEFDALGKEHVWLLSAERIVRLSDRIVSRAITLPSPIPVDELNQTPFVILSDGAEGAFFGSRISLYHHASETNAVRSITVGEGTIGNGITGGLRDREGGVWIACTRGISFASWFAFENYSKSQGLLTDEVVSLLELSPSEIVFGQPGGVSFFKNNRFSQLPFPSSTERKAHRSAELCADREGGFWVAAEELGVFHCDRNKRFTPYSLPGQFISSVYKDRDGTVWAGTDWGLWRLTETGFVSVPIRSQSGDVRSVFIRRVGEWQGRLTLGTRDDGLIVRESDGFRTIPCDSEGLKSIYAFLTTRSGRFLVATHQGVAEMKDGVLSRAAEFARVPAPTYSLLEDPKHGQWFGTARGIVRHGNSGWRHYTRQHGLVGMESNRAAVLVDHAGQVWLGTDRGVSRYRPHGDIPDPAPAPLPFLSSLEASAAEGCLPTDFESRIELAPGTDDLFVQFGAATFRSRELEFSYRLKGQDESWVHRKSGLLTNVRYANLIPGVYRFEVRARRPGGELGPITRTPEFVVTARASPLRTAFIALSYAAVAGLLFALFQLWRGHRRVSESERRYRQIFERNRSAQMLIDARSATIIEGNTAAATFYGLSIAELRSLPLVAVCDATEASLRERFLNVLQHGGDQFVLHQRDALRRTREVEFRASVYHEESGLVQATAHDITEQRELDRVLASTRKLEAVGRLAGGVAHDFNNVLAVIVGCAENVESILTEGSEARADLEEILRTASRGAALVKRLLVVGQRNVAAPEVLRINDVVHELERLLRRILPSNIRVLLLLSEDAGAVRADHTELEHALLNLVINGRDAMPEGGELVLSTKALEIKAEDGSTSLSGSLTPGSYVALRVTDSGFGMSSEVLGRAFEPFFTTKDEDHGTGLGLPAVHAFATASGGYVSLKSHVGQGTTCEILLPRVDVPTSAVTRIQPSRPVDSARKTILVVDDEEGVRRITALTLQRAGYRVHDAATIEEALAAVAKQPSSPPDLLLTDVVMPDRCGVEVAAIATQHYPKLRVLFMSGYPGNELASRGISEDRLIAKPFRARELVARIEQELLGETSSEARESSA